MSLLKGSDMRPCVLMLALTAVACRDVAAPCNAREVVATYAVTHYQTTGVCVDTLLAIRNRCLHTDSLYWEPHDHCGLAP